MEPIQNPLFREPIGATFKSKRERMGLSIEDAAKSLKFGSSLIEAIENEQWDRLGAPIFAKSYINSYIKLLGLNEAIRDEIPNISPPPPLKAITHARIEPAHRHSKWWLALLTIAGLAAVTAYFGLRKAPTESLSLDKLIVLPAEPPKPAPTAAAPVESTQIAIPAADGAPATAIAQTVAVPAAAPADAEVLIRTAQESWVEIRGKDGSVLYSGLLRTGQEVRQSLGKIGKITLGNASGAQLSVNGTALDLKALIRDEVARFTFDGEGKPVAITP